MIAIKGIRIDGISIKRNEKGQYQISSSYSLISTKDVVLAEQSVGNGYNEMKLEPSTETLKALQEFATLYEKDMGKRDHCTVLIKGAVVMTKWPMKDED